MGGAPAGGGAFFGVLGVVDGVEVGPEGAAGVDGGVGGKTAGRPAALRISGSFFRSGDANS